MSFTAREMRAIVRKAVSRVPEGEEIRHLNIMPMMDMMTILLVAFIFQAAVSATALAAQTVSLPHALNEEPLPEELSTLIIARTEILVEGDPIASIGANGMVDASDKGGSARSYQIPALTAALNDLRLANEEKAKKEEREPPAIPELLIIADRTTQFRVLFDVLFSAKELPAGFKRFRLLVMRHEPVGFE
jgi:biopolymer transport protein ExbD